MDQQQQNSDSDSLTCVNEHMLCVHRERVAIELPPARLERRRKAAPRHTWLDSVLPPTAARVWTRHGRVTDAAAGGGGVR